MIRSLNSRTPNIGTNVFVAQDAWVIGDVELGDNVSVFFGAVLRGDIEKIRVGRGSNIQEHCVFHTSHGTPVTINEEVTIGHRAVIHGATVSSRCLIGMGAILLDGALIEEECMIGAGCLIPEGKRIPKRSLVIGVPGKVVRNLTNEEITYIAQSAEHYMQIGAQYRREGFGENV